MRVSNIAQGLVVVLVVAACSTPAMKTTPMWDREYGKAEGPPEDRINLWPLFYYREPAYAILWPLISATEDGHAVVPLYEHDRTRQQLRLLTLHPSLPAGALIQPDYVRILNAAHHREEGWSAIFPLIFRDSDRLLVIPVLYRNASGFWTPLLTRYKWPEGSLTGVLGPLIASRREGEFQSWHCPWPLLAGWRGPERLGFRALPLIWYEREGSDRLLNIGGALFHRRRQGERLSIHWAWPLGAAGRDEARTWNRFIPLWYSVRDDDQSIFASLPYLKLRDADSSWRSYFGLLHRFEGRDWRGHALLPLYWRHTRPGRGETLLTLFGGYWRSDDRELLDLLGPVYWSYRDGESRSRAVLWPLYRQWEKGDEKGETLLPLYHRYHGPERWAFHTPILSLGETHPDTSFWSLGLGLVRHESGPVRTKSRLLFGLMGHDRDQAEQRRSLWAFPLFGWRSGATSYRFNSLPLSLHEAGVDADDLRRQATESFARAPAEATESKRTVPLRGWGSLLGWIQSRHSVEVHARRDEAGSVDVTLRDLRKSHIRPLWIVPVFSSRTREGESSELEILWRLYDGEARVLEDGRSYSRQRVLWRIFHRETLGPRTSIDAFPFIAYDSDENLLQWSFMGGLVGWRSKADGRRLRLLYIPIDL